jgi:hypothetical protein
MKLKVSRIAAAGAVVGLFGLGGVGYAYAQSTTTVPSTTPGNAPSNDSGGGHSTTNCPNMGGSSDSATTPNASSGV